VAVLRLLLALDLGFTAAESVATAVAMVWNFFLNNRLTYRDCRLTGWQAVRGLASFMLLCGLGAFANVAVARDLYGTTGLWLLAGMCGAGWRPAQLCPDLDLHLASAGSGRHEVLHALYTISRLTRSGTVSVSLPIWLSSNSAEAGEGSTLNSSVRAPRRLASASNPATGWFAADIPITANSSHSAAAW